MYISEKSIYMNTIPTTESTSLSTPLPDSLPSSLSTSLQNKPVLALAIRPETPWLAPLAGWSDMAFRLLCIRQGAAVCCSEMVSAKGLEYASPGTVDLLQTCPEDTPLVMQLFGAEPDCMARATTRLIEKGFQYFDVNMGCSVPKVTRTGAGSALLRTPELALEIAQAMIAVAGQCKIGFKLRLGWDTANDTAYKQIAVGLEAAGAAWITLHPRTAKQGFTGKADWSALRELKNLVSIPVIASGDLLCAEDAMACLEQTGADAVMYGRGALKDPGIFAQHARLIRGEACAPVCVADLLARVRQHIALMQEHDSERRALLKMRTIIPRTTKGFGGIAGKALRLSLMSCSSWDDVERALQTFENAAAN